MKRTSVMIMNKISNSQKEKNNELQKIKKALIDRYGKRCMICRINDATDLMHLLPKSIFPEHYTSPWNFVTGCRSCHDLYDSSAAFRRKTGFYEHVKAHDSKGAYRYFQMHNIENDI